MKIPSDEPPPFMGTWSRVYTAVVIYLVTIITLFYFFERLFT
jgi:hypothetical protein